ncbi:hypothetical protein KY285_022736 [Solanum tuberosum]|nr:hypothetical protein KY285_022736 [Solanum tuberosum]
MTTITYDPNFNLQKIKEYPQHKALLEEIEGLIKVYKDGHVERPQIVPNVTNKLPLELGVTSSDVVIDSAGGNIAYNVAIMLRSKIGDLKPIALKGIILIQPFFGGESRTYSEKYTIQPLRSALTLASADTYWRLALPTEVNRDHPWCNPIGKEGVNLVDIRNIPGILAMHFKY